MDALCQAAGSMNYKNSIMDSDLQRIHAVIGARHDRFGGATILVTGCAGFLGFYFLSYLVRYASELGLSKVIGLDTFLLAKPAWLEKLQAEFPGTLSLHTFDVARDKLESIKGVDEARYVVHMASIASPTFYRKFPLETIDANIWGLRHLLDYFQKSKKLEGFLFFSSSEIYGDPDSAHIPTAEDYRGNVSAIGPRACYDEAKRFGETLCHVFATTYGMPITLARPFNNYGPGMRLDDRRLPADFARNVMEGKDLVIHSDGAPTRTFCYVADAITGYLLCLLHRSFDVFNIGIEKPEITVAQLADIYRKAGQKIMDYKGAVRYEPSGDKDYLGHNPQRRRPVITRAREVLGYDPQIQVEEGIARYLQFLFENTGH